MQDLLAALCLVMVLEGIMPFVAPGAWRQTMRQATEMTDRSLRTMGAVLMLLGLLCLVWVRNGQ